MNANTIVWKIVISAMKFFGIVIFVICLVQGGYKAYHFGRNIFMDEPVATLSNARTINITIKPGESRMDIAEMLERINIIQSAKVFYVQSLLYENGMNLKPGDYELSTAMTAEEIMETIAAKNDE